MTVVVKELSAAEFPSWDAYVERTEQATFFHRAAWSNVLSRAFGHRSHFMYAERDGQVVGVLPLSQMKSLLFGHTLCSLPFCVYGGIVADDEAVEAALRERACALADSLGVDSLEMRNRRSTGTEWPVKDLYFTFRKEILPDEEANLMAIPNRQRAMIRKGIKEGLASEIGRAHV